jgi:hypothetical protein
MTFTSAPRDPDNYCWIADQERFMYAPSRGLWTRGTVIKQVGNEVATAIERERVCSNVTWIPGAPEFIKDKVVVDGELEDYPGNNLFNMFRPARPISKNADPDKAAFWLDLGRHLFNEEDLARLLDCLAFKVQNPGLKINRGFIIGSREQGIGKDAFIVAVRRAIGSANWGIKGATGVIRAIEKDFTAGFLQKTVLQISEVHELGEKRFSAYDSQKDWKAAPPNYLNVADKNVKEHPIQNAVLVIQTTNHLTDGPYIPPEDRREDVIWSKALKTDMPRLTKLEPKVYWSDYFERLNKRGDDEHVAAFLMQRDLSKFMPGEEPPKTEAWKQIVGVNRPTGDAGLLDLLDHMATDWVYMTGDLQIRPPAITLDQIKRHRFCPLELAKLIDDKGKARTVAHRLGSAGYATFDRPGNAQGYWTINGKRQVIFTPNELDPDEKQAACEALVRVEEMAASGSAPTGSAPEDGECDLQ